MSEAQRIPQLLKPRFRHIQNQANLMLLNMGKPMPPMPLADYAKCQKWKIVYEELLGPDGYMLKYNVKGKVRYGIYIATDHNLSGTITPQIERTQYWTLAHEIGHIILHGDFILNSNFDECEIDGTTKTVLEVEAHWFAARLLMPDYVFQDYWDLVPERLAEKCFVNLTPAQKRISSLSQIHRRYIETVEPHQVIEEREIRLRRYWMLEQEKHRKIDEMMIDKWRRIYGFD